MEILLKALALISTLAFVAACTSDDALETVDDSGVLTTTTLDRLSLAVPSGEVWVDLSSNRDVVLDDGGLSIEAGMTVELTVTACPRPVVILFNDVAEIGKVFEEDESGRTRPLQIYLPADLPIGEYSLEADCFYSGDVGWSNPRQVVVILPGRSNGGLPPAEAQPSYVCVFDAEPPCEP